MFKSLYLFAIISIASAEYKYETKWFKVPLDHFSFQRNETFEIKYLVNDDYWDQGSGPIFFYTGNEKVKEIRDKSVYPLWVHEHKQPINVPLLGKGLLSSIKRAERVKVIIHTRWPNADYWIRHTLRISSWACGFPYDVFLHLDGQRMGQIELFAKHTGFIWEIAPEYKAKIVFAEHRYYGASLPFGNKSLDNEHIGYLSSAQALADYAALIDFLQGNAIKPRYPVIAFGGSYGGMLSAYFRIKYPHIVNGAIAASAPVHMFTGMAHCDIFNRLVTSSFRIITTNCSNNIKESWSVIRNYSATANGSEWLHKNWNLCSPIKNSTDLDMLLEFLNSMYSTLAMVNYPFASDFLMPLPAEPVRVVCQYLSEKLSGEKLLEGIGKVLDIFTNYDKKSKCVDYKQGDDYGNLDATGWDYQACTEMVMPMCSDGKNDMFEPSPWNYTKYAAECHKKYNVYPREQMARLEYGGNRLQAASNIIFSNGLRDPWTGGGILDSMSESVRAVVIVDAAHHLDLMPSNPNDPETVKMARKIHKQHITKWINQFREQLTSTRHVYSRFG